MRGAIHLLIGFVLLWGSVLPLSIVAQVGSQTNYREANNLPLLIRPQKRDPEITYKAIQVVEQRTSAKETLSPTSDVRRPNLLPVVDQEDILAHHRILANEVLRALPSQCVNSLKNFYVRYDNPKRRGLAGKTTIILDGTVPDEEFIALLIHEFGHITDLGCIEGNTRAVASAFKDGSEKIYMNDASVSFYSISWINAKEKQPTAESDDFVSGYAKWDPFEDFAETFAYYILQNDSFRQRARENPVLAAKYRWMDRNVFKNSNKIAEGEFDWEGEIPWDTTKLPYRWLADEEIAMR